MSDSITMSKQIPIREARFNEFWLQDQIFLDKQTIESRNDTIEKLMALAKKTVDERGGCSGKKKWQWCVEQH
jgi:hypothetical protein